MENQNFVQPKKSVCRKIRWIMLAILVGGVLYGLNYLYPFSYYLPHEKPVLILPIDSKYDDRVGIMPMGEKIEHPNTPSGHPGIDFGFALNPGERIPYIASMDGKISSVDVTENNEKPNGKKVSVTKRTANVIITSGAYQIRYVEMDAETLPETIKVGVKIKQGDLVGYGNLTKDTDKDTLHQMIHWELGSISPLLDRFCPLTFLTQESRKRLESFWPGESTEQGITAQMRVQYPKICNGDYDGKDGK